MGKVKLPPGLQYKSGKYIIDKFIAGARIKKRLSVTTQAEAIEEYSRVIADHSRGILVSHKASSLTVYYVLEYYYNKHMQHIKSYSDARHHIPVLDRHIGNFKVMDLKKSDIETFKRNRAAEKNKSGGSISPRTIQAELQILTMAIRYAIGDRLIPHNPVEGLCSVEVPRKPIVVLDDGYDQGDEWIRLYDRIPERWKLFCLIQYEAGLRPSEVEQFQCEWIHSFGSNYMILIPGEDEKTDAYYRRIPVSNRLAEKLIPVCLNQTGSLFQSTDYAKMIRKAVMESGINQKVQMKSLRKTRLSIWDAIDENASRVAGGHVPRDVHEKSYARVNDARLFKLVGIEIDQKLKIFKQA